MRVTLMLMTAVALHAAGCVQTTRVTSPRYEKGKADLLAMAPTSAVYEVRWSDDGKSFRALQGSQRVVADAQAIGFESGLDVEVVAVAGKDRFELQHLPSRARYLMWQAEVRDATAIGSIIGNVLSAPVNLVTAIGALLDTRSRDGTRSREARPDKGPSSGDDWATRWSEQERQAREAEKESKRESARLRRIFGLPPKPHDDDCD